MTIVVKRGSRFRCRNSERTCCIEKLDVSDSPACVVHFYYDDEQSSGVTWTETLDNFVDKWVHIGGMES